MRRGFLSWQPLSRGIFNLVKNEQRLPFLLKLQSWSISLWFYWGPLGSPIPKQPTKVNWINDLVPTPPSDTLPNDDLAMDIEPSPNEGNIDAVVKRQLATGGRDMAGILRTGGPTPEAA